MIKREPGQQSSSNDTSDGKQQLEAQEVKSVGKIKGQDKDHVQTARKPQRKRYRASVACATCRDRRIRCVVPQGEKECTQCKRSGVKCIIKNDDERRRPISRAYMCSLTDRIAHLERLLRECGIAVPPASHPPKTGRGCPLTEPHPPNRQSVETQCFRDTSSSEGTPSPQHIDENDQGEPCHTREVDHVYYPPMDSPPRREGIVIKSLSTTSHLTFDKFNDRLRYFGPTTSSQDSDTEPPAFKRRQTSRSRADTGPSKRRGVSISRNFTNIDLAINLPAYTSRLDSGHECSDTFMMTTPGSYSSHWFVLGTPGLEHAPLTPSVTSPWMGTDFSASEMSSPLTMVHPPKLPSISGVENPSRLNFLSMGYGMGDLRRGWPCGAASGIGVGIGAGIDIDGFAPPCGSREGWDNYGG
ncbi:hypothetical protein BDV95DRAFT_591316 [Massariosphaeria phaeospora]|uniref:Zn(2)-C6 fungal-type domain-containing protein n=1 Tax=Massariosphaeria phaeospora TaxID=100035 RepID=A0A7C8IC20_9PLEO|nr:hypothetical protein BDV95DRAFT_591316 [Massariosphaeria phaeospora]